MIMAIVFVLVNLLVDLLYAFIRSSYQIFLKVGCILMNTNKLTSKEEQKTSMTKFKKINV